MDYSERKNSDPEQETLEKMIMEVFNEDENENETDIPTSNSEKNSAPMFACWSCFYGKYLSYVELREHINSEVHQHNIFTSDHILCLGCGQYFSSDCLNEHAGHPSYHNYSEVQNSEEVIFADMGKDHLDDQMHLTGNQAFDNIFQINMRDDSDMQGTSSKTCTRDRKDQDRPKKTTKSYLQYSKETMKKALDEMRTTGTYGVIDTE